MFKLFRRLACIALVAGLPASVLAASPNTGVQAMRQKLESMIPGHAPDSVKATPVPGLFQVRYGMQVFYISANGRYLLRGDLIDLKTRTDITSRARRIARIKVLTGLPTDSLLTYRPKGKVKHVIYVFSDVNCPYCELLHAEVPKLNSHGIEVRYLFFPRSGLGTPSALEAESVWCAKNPERAYDRVMAGDSVKPAKCANPVARDFKLGEQMGVKGTPTIVLADGHVLPGYLPTEELLQVIKKGRLS